MHSVRYYKNHFGVVSGQTASDKSYIARLKKRKDLTRVQESERRLLKIKENPDAWDISMIVTCRESFHSYTDGKVRKFAFMHRGGKGKAIAAFIKKFEDKLGLSQKDRCEFIATQFNNVTCIKIPSWWSDHQMRRSLLTILIRNCGPNYLRSKDNFDTALYNHEYITGTKMAVERFLEGYTHYTGEVTGWVYQFRYNGRGSWDQKGPAITKEDISKLLIKPI